AVDRERDRVAALLRGRRGGGGAAREKNREKKGREAERRRASKVHGSLGESVSKKRARATGTVAFGSRSLAAAARRVKCNCVKSRAARSALRRDHERHGP